MLYELDVLETRRIAELAGDLRKVRDRLLEKVPEQRFAEPPPARGEHNPLAALDLHLLLMRTPEFAGLQNAIDALPREIREKIWAVAQLGAAKSGIGRIDQALAEAAALSDEALSASLLGEPELQRMLGKGLYQLGAAAPPT